MEPTRNRWSREDAAAYTLLEVTIVDYYADAGLIAPAHEGYSEHDLAELRAVRRLMNELEFDHPAIEVILRMRRRMLVMQREMARMEAELRRARRTRITSGWLDAEWDEL